MLWCAILHTPIAPNQLFAMKEQENIPASKVERATRFVKTGFKVGANYVKHYTQKALNQEVTREDLDRANAGDIYETLSELKGSALKVAQMLSMERNLLPDTYADIFSMAQHNAPPLSGPLIVKTFKQYMQHTPQELFDEFDMQAAYAASIGQVHRAVKNGRQLAVKIQYPGVADSVKSDLKLVKPFALRLLNMKEKDVRIFFDEVENKLLEETDYELELQRSVSISQKCNQLENLSFARYYPELSSKRILTMDWLNGVHLTDFINSNPSRELRNQIGQALWDFYSFQMHNLRLTHADPHPGNFLVQPNGKLAVLDFGCVKEIPESLYQPYFDVANPLVLNNPAELEKRFIALSMIYPDDTQADKDFFIPVFSKMINLLAAPFRNETFDFADDSFMKAAYEYGEQLARMPEIRNSGKPRGSQHVLYINRTFFGLYKLLNSLKANVKTRLL